MGFWPYVMRRVLSLWAETEFTRFGLAIVGDRVLGTVNVCTAEGLASYVVLSFNYTQDWEQRVVVWMVNLLCCAVGQVSPVGVSCSLLPRLEHVLVGNSGLRAVSLVPLRISDLNKVLVDVSVRVMGGVDVHSLLNHLQTRMRDFVQDDVLLACPKLLQVSMCYVLAFLKSCVFFVFVYLKCVSGRSRRGFFIHFDVFFFSLC